MQDEDLKRVDHSVNPLVAEIEASARMDTEKKQNKQRRYWTSQEEQCFFEIWGRDNWHLTKNGKNTVYFAQWSDELKERHNIDVRPEEIQAKVNQTRAKFRSVKRHPKFNKHNPQWKKFDIIDRILKNKYRPENAEPIPLDILRKNRDVSPDSNGENDDEPGTEQPSTPTSLTSNSQDTSTTQQPQGVIMSTDQLNNSSLTEHDISSTLFNANELQPNPNYASQLYPDIKDEYISDYSQQSNYQTQYTQPNQNHFTSGVTDEQPRELLELQTPHQQLQSQQHIPTTQQHMEQPPQYNNVISTSTYEHHSVPNNAAGYETSNVYNNQAQYNNNSRQLSELNSTMQQTYNNNINQSFVNNTNTNNASNLSNNNNTNNGPNLSTTNNGTMQPPRPTTQLVVPRKRGRQSGTQANHAFIAANSIDPSLESMYLDEVRKKNVILDEQMQIARKRLLVEERKITLMEQFFPKCLELQMQILDKLQFSKTDTPREQQ